MIGIDDHLPVMCDFWETILLRTGVYRGSAFAFGQDAELTAEDYFVRNYGTARNLRKPDTRFQQLGGTLGGPIKKDKLFFFGGYEYTTQESPTSSTISLPTELQRAGDFSQTFNASGQLMTIYNPFDTFINAQGNLERRPFPGNVIPADRINPIGRMMLNLLPMPNADDPTGNRQYNYTYQNLLEKPKHDNVGRVDWNIAPGSTFYTRLGFSNEVNSRGANAFLGVVILVALGGIGFFLLIMAAAVGAFAAWFEPRHDVLWDMAPHDVAMAVDLAGAAPTVSWAAVALSVGVIVHGRMRRRVLRAEVKRHLVRRRRVGRHRPWPPRTVHASGVAQYWPSR